MTQRRRYTVKATWQSGETKTLGFVREGRAEAYAAHAHRFGAAVTLTDTETGVVLLEMNGPFPVAIAPERAQQRIDSFEWGGPMGGVKRDVFAAGASDFPAEWLDLDGNRRLGGFVRFTGSQPGGATIGGSSLVYRFTITGADQAAIDTGVDVAQAGSNDWTNADLLEVLITARTDDAGAAINQGLLVTLNNDATNSYDRQNVTGSGAAVGASAPAQPRANWDFWVHGSGGRAAVATVVRLSIPSPTATTFEKTAECTLSMPDQTTTNQIAGTYALLWQNTSAVTRLKASAAGAQKLKVGSQLLIYKRSAS